MHLYCRALLNKAALHACGYTKDTPNPPGGEIVRDSHGNPTGLLIARPNATILYATLAKGPKLPPEHQMNSTRHFMQELNRLGLTSIIDAGGGSQNYPGGFHVPTGAMFNRKNEHLSIEREFQAVIHRLKRHAAHTTKCPEWLDVEALERRLPIGKGSLIVLDIPLPGTWAERQQQLYTDLVAASQVAQSWKFEHFEPPENELLLFAYHYEDEHPQKLRGANVIDSQLFPASAWNRLQELNQQLGCELFEGLVAKRVDSLYPIQSRSPDVEFPFWMKHRWAF